MSSHLHFIVETESLENASPPILSRFALIFLSSEEKEDGVKGTCQTATLSDFSRNFFRLRIPPMLSPLKSESLALICELIEPMIS